MWEIWNGINIDPDLAAKYREMWEADAKGMPPAPATGGTTNTKEWPLLARMIAKAKTDADAGLGDTIHRNLGRFGADGMKKLYKRIAGSDCGCQNRQLVLNRRYPYCA